MLFFEISIFALDVFVRPKGHGISLFLVMESHEKSWNLNFQKEYEPFFWIQTPFLCLSISVLRSTILSMNILLFVVYTIILPKSVGHS